MTNVWQRTDSLVLQTDEGWTAARGLILEIVSPAGLEAFFEQALALFEGGVLPRPEETVRLARSYGCEVDVAGTPAFLARHGLRPPNGPPPDRP